MKTNLESSKNFALDFNISFNDPGFLYFTVLFTKLPWPGENEGASRFLSQAATCPSVYHKQWRLHTVPFYCWTSRRKAVNTNFYSLWFDATGNRAQVYLFCSRPSIHSTTDWFKSFVRYQHSNFKFYLLQQRFLSVFIFRLLQNLIWY